MKKGFLCLSLLLLVSCNLRAQLLGGGREFTFTKTYALQSEQHAFKVTFAVNEGKVTGLAFEPQTSTPSEHGQQNAFSANVRRYVLERAPTEIFLPQVIGDASPELIGAFRGAVEDLRTAAP
ncbi:MAG: hypothetical protein AAB853_03125 [Patescibacteria group bacterium]